MLNHAVRPRALLLFSSICTCMLACSQSAAPTPVSAVPPAPAVAVSALGPGDVFDVRVFDEKELSNTYRVATDGSIDFPLIGKVQVGGRTTQEVGTLLVEKLGIYLKNPSVSIFVKEYNSKKIFVMGQVKRPGTFPYEDGMNIIQAITLAGGLEKFANGDGTYLTRTVEGRETRLKVPVKAIGEGKAPNVRLEPGDIVYVPESLF